MVGMTMPNPAVLPQTAKRTVDPAGKRKPRACFLKKD